MRPREMRNARSRSIRRDPDRGPIAWSGCDRFAEIWTVIWTVDRPLHRKVLQLFSLHGLDESKFPAYRGQGNMWGKFWRASSPWTTTCLVVVWFGGRPSPLGGETGTPLTVCVPSRPMRRSYRFGPGPQGLDRSRGIGSCDRLALSTFDEPVELLNPFRPGYSWCR